MIVVHNWKHYPNIIPKAGEVYRIGPAIQTAVFRVGSVVISKVDREGIPGYLRIFGRAFYVTI